MNSDASMSVNCNMRLIAINGKGEVVQVREKHNKANVMMVEGLLRFLQGHFNSTIYNKDKGGGVSDDAIPYLPVRLSFGTVGVKSSVDTDYDEERPMFSAVDKDEQVVPTFNSFELQDEIPELSEEIPPLKFSEMEISSYEDLNNSESLRIIAQVDPGKLVGRNQEGSGYINYSRSFWNPSSRKWETMLTEVGLYSETNMLARVLFDGEVKRVAAYNSDGDQVGWTYSFDDKTYPFNPLVQDEDTTIVVEWRIGLVSIGENDEFSANNDVEDSQIVSAVGEALGDDARWSGTQSEAESLVSEILSSLRVIPSN